MISNNKSAIKNTFLVLPDRKQKFIFFVFYSFFFQICYVEYVWNVLVKLRNIIIILSWKVTVFDYILLFLYIIFILWDCHLDSGSTLWLIAWWNKNEGKILAPIVKVAVRSEFTMYNYICYANKNAHSLFKRTCIFSVWSYLR